MERQICEVRNGEGRLACQDLVGVEGDEVVDFQTQNSEFQSCLLKSGLAFGACPLHEAFPDP